ncbi:DUF1848 domain-containing protein [Pseudomonas sp. 43A]|uniref:DUF1848 domain-containing protein n=1 Tax=Pseudomonas TaxID=286 RepID=UPI001587BCA7|nr:MULTISPECIES: DUF1848 domain-containing protein [unclassified Pseudomonas]QKV64547.1 DUF1848 domain-containing protein [Pseudomonas sp. 43A]QMW07309.1 DUF1848 domain-containing protein [Pseudomonas sp. 29A]
MIISASRRTDIPAFYAEWFIKRVRAGFLLTRNPFNHNQIRRVSMLAQDVEAIVFWTRNPTNLMPYLPELDERGFNYYFQYTITGYPRSLERSVPNPYKAIEEFRKLSSQLGARRVIWRYDPVLLSNLLPLEEHKRLFQKIAKNLSGYTRRVVVSFSDFYKKTEKNLRDVEGLICSDIAKDRESLQKLTDFMAKTAAQHDMEIFTCAEEVEVNEIGHGKCIDERLIQEVFGLSLSGDKDKGQRESCGCIKSVDVGVYNTCLHGCSYCYATFSHERVISNKRNHDPDSPFLVGSAEGIDPDLLLAVKSQASLF